MRRKCLVPFFLFLGNNVNAIETNNYEQQVGVSLGLPSTDFMRQAWQNKRTIRFSENTRCSVLFKVPLCNEMNCRLACKDDCHFLPLPKMESINVVKLIHDYVCQETM